MKHLLFLILLLSYGLQSEAQPVNHELFVVLTTEDAETQMMAMVLATQSVNQNVPVSVLLCSSAGQLAVKGFGSTSFAPAGRSPKQLLSGLIDKGVTVNVCGIFLPNRDIQESDLLDGVGVASPPDIASFMKKRGVRYFTF